MQQLREKLLSYGCIAAILGLCFAPINKPLTNVFLILALLCSLLGARLYERLLLALNHPVVKGCLLWMFVLTLSAIHALLLGGEVKSFGSSTLALAYPVLFASLMEDDKWRNRAMLAFVAAVGFVLLISYMLYFGMVPAVLKAHMKMPDLYVPFKEYTQQGLSFLLMASIALAYSLQSDLKPKTRYVLFAIGLLAIINVLFILRSRTALLTIIPLLVFWLFRVLQFKLPQLKTRQLGVVLAGVILLGGTLVWNSSHFQTWVVKGAGGEVSGYLKNKEVTSMGGRLVLWEQTIKIIRNAPVLGHGLQQWKPKYVEQTNDLPNFEPYKNFGHPHQEAMQIASEEGLLGLLIWIGLLIALWRYIGLLDAPFKDIYYSLLLVYVTAGLANALWADFTHRHTFILLLACIPFAVKPKNV